MPISFVQKVFDYCLRFMHGYRSGLVGPVLEYAVKKYKSQDLVVKIEREVRNRFSSSEDAKEFNIRDKLNQLYSAVTVIRAWKSTGTDDFSKFIQYIYQHATQVAVSLVSLWIAILVSVKYATS